MTADLTPETRAEWREDATRGGITDAQYGTGTHARDRRILALLDALDEAERERDEARAEVADLSMRLSYEREGNRYCHDCDDHNPSRECPNREALARVEEFRDDFNASLRMAGIHKEFDAALNGTGHYKGDRP
jgi:hypothetical protein